MRHRSFIVLASLLMLLIFGSVAVYAVDASGEDTISEGVTIAGVDVGGMKAEEARAAVAQQVEEPLQKPLRVAYHGRTFKLSAKRAKVKADVDAMVDDALARSREGNVISRFTRELTGGEVHADIPSAISYDDKAVDKLVARVERSVEQPATEASVRFSGTGLDKVKGQDGVALRSEALLDAVGDELVHPTPERTVKARVTRTKSKVGIDDLAGKYPVVVTVDRANFKLRVYRKLELVESYPIAVGQAGLETPAGLYHIQNKATNPAWHVPNSAWAGSLAGQVIPGGAPNNPLKARWLGIYNGAGIHGTSDIGSLGTAASHGCIRMAVPDVTRVYDDVPVGAPVYIA